MFRNVSTAPKPASSSGASNGASPPKQGAFNGATVTPSGQRYRPMDDPVFTSTWQSSIYPQHPEYFIHDKQGKPTVRADCQAQAQSAYIEYRLQKLEFSHHLPIIFTDGKMVDGQNTASARQRRIEMVAGLYAGHPHIQRVTDRELVEAFPPPPSASVVPYEPWLATIFGAHRELFMHNSMGLVQLKDGNLAVAKNIYFRQRIGELEQERHILERAVFKLLKQRHLQLAYSEAEKRELTAFIASAMSEDVTTNAMRIQGDPSAVADEFLMARMDEYCQANVDRRFQEWQTAQYRYVEIPAPVVAPSLATPSAPPLEPQSTVATSTWDVSQSDHEKYLLIKGLVKHFTKNGLQPFLEFALDARYASPYPELYLLINEALTCGDDEPVKKVRVNELCKRILKLTRGIMADEYFANNQKPIEGHELNQSFAKAFWQACNKDQIRVQLQSVIRDPNAPPSFAFAVAQ